jgi:fibronectin-binding autotransporter adhesin
MARLYFLLPAVLLTLAVPPSANAQTWTNAVGDQNWNNASNWTPATIPNSAGAAVTFGDASYGTANLCFITSSVQAGSLNFASVRTGDFGLGSDEGQTLSGLTAINVSSTTFGTKTIDLSYQAGGNLLFANAGSLTVTNNRYTVGPGLVIGPDTVIGTPGFGGVVFAGMGYTQLSGSFASGNSYVYGGLTKTGPGQLDFSGDATQLHGGLALNGGTLTLDYTNNAATKIGGGFLNLSGGVLQMLTDGTAVTDSAAGTTLAANHTEITASGPVSTNVITLNLGAITRSPGATVDITSSGPTFVGQTSTGNTNGLLGTGPAYATTGLGVTWATSNGGFINGLPPSSYGSDTYSPGTNTDYVGPYRQLSANTTTNSIRFNDSSTSSTLDLFSAILTVQSGGILMTANSGPVTIGYFGSPGTLTTPGGNGELLVHQYNTSNALTIDANIVAFGGLTKTGPGTLILGGVNNLGTINVNQGNLTITNTAAVNSSFTINLNDNVQAHAGQYVNVDLGNFVNGTISTNFRLGTPTYGSAFDTGSSTNSVVTLSGVISSIAGMATPVYFGLGQYITSSVNVTGNNTFLGNVNLNGGTLGINSNASLGNAANPLILAVGSSTAGGLVFLNGGVNLARPVEVVGGGYYNTRIASNGSDVNTISGVISDYQAINYGSGRVYKAGTGTLILSGMNTYSGGTEIDAGTLSVGADANLGAAGTPLSINAGGTLGISSSFTTARPLLLGPNPATGGGPTNINVAVGQTFTPTGGISDNIFAGTLTLNGPGTVVLTTPNTYSGGTNVWQGTLQLATETCLGSGPVTVNPLGTLLYSASTTAGQAITLLGGTLAVVPGATLTLQNATVGGGFLVGTFATMTGASSALVGGTTTSSTVLTLNGSDALINFSQGGQLNIAAGQNVTLSRVTNQGSGSIILGAGSMANAADFQSNGLLTLNPATVGSGHLTELVNTGSSPMYFNGGSRTFIGTPATAGNNVAGVDLHGQNLVIAGGLFVNNGFVADSTGSPGSVIVDFGALYKGAGTNFVSIITQNGGKVQAGNSPGSMGFGKFVFGPGGVNNYVFAIDNATGTAGPNPDALGYVSGWGLVKAVKEQYGATTTSGDFIWTATPGNQLTFALDTLVNPTMVGTDVGGPMANFDPTQSYAWPAVHWDGTYSGPTDSTSLAASTAFDTSGFVNAAAGTFGWNLDPNERTLLLTYTPTAVPEPGTLVLSGMAAIGWVTFWRRRWQSYGPSATLSA